VSGRVVAAAIDRRVGGSSIQAAAQWKWGDAETVMNACAQTSVDWLGMLQSSVQ